MKTKLLISKCAYYFSKFDKDAIFDYLEIYSNNYILPIDKEYDVIIIINNIELYNKLKNVNVINVDYNYIFELLEISHLYRYIYLDIVNNDVIDKNIRFYYYLGDNIRKSVVVDEKYRKFRQNKVYYYLGKNVVDENLDSKFWQNGWWWGYNKGFCVDFPCLAISADGYENDSLPTLSKARIVESINKSIIVKFGYKRHWEILETFLDDIDWGEKVNDVVWRGVDITGYRKKYNRHYFINRFGDKYNTKFIKSPMNRNNIDNILWMYGNKLSFNEQCKYKYLLSIEGNDVATGLKWMLASNSVVLMTKPFIESWLMEGLLIPFYHYVPINDDYSNFVEILEWCKNNDNICREIAENAKKWMTQFFDKNLELEIFNRLCNWYKTNINIQFKTDIKN